MRRVIILIGLISVIAYLTGCAETPKRINNEIIVKNSLCEKFLSIKNDGSMPKDSLTQRYEIVCEVEGELHESTLEITVDQNGSVKETKIMDSTKIMIWDIQYMPILDFCPDGYERRCARICDFPLEGEPTCYLVCFCIKFNY